MRDQRDFERWLHRARRELYPKLHKSAVLLSICPPYEAEPDPAFCLELGAAIMLGKPIIAILPKGRPVPPALRKVADVLVEDVDMGNPDDMERVQQAVLSLLQPT